MEKVSQNTLVIQKVLQPLRTVAVIVAGSYPLAEVAQILSDKYMYDLSYIGLLAFLVIFVQPSIPWQRLVASMNIAFYVVLFEINYYQSTLGLDGCLIVGGCGQEPLFTPVQERLIVALIFIVGTSASYALISRLVCKYGKNTNKS